MGEVLRPGQLVTRVNEGLRLCQLMTRVCVSMRARGWLRPGRVMARVCVCEGGLRPEQLMTRMCRAEAQQGHGTCGMGGAVSRCHLMTRVCVAGEGSASS